MDELRSWLTLQQVPRLGPATWQKLNQHFSPVELCHQSYPELTAIGLSDKQASAIVSPDEAFIEKCLAWAGKCKQLIPQSDNRFPQSLKHTADPPLLLFAEGDVELLSQPQIAVVGSRNASPAGRRHAIAFSRSLAEVGAVVTSGLAVGIDGYAHQGALQAGKTIAVIGAGLDRLYPKRHITLAKEIVATGGCLVSELPPWFEAKAFQFPRRNRIISGMSFGVLVVEASLQSGSLITARYAAEQGRDVYAIPGAIGNPGVSGCHKLIQEGAKLVESVDDIIQEWPEFFAEQFINRQMDEGKERQSLPFQDLLDNVGDEGISVDQLSALTGLPVDAVLTQLLELELSGAVAAVPGGYIRIRGT